MYDRVIVGLTTIPRRAGLLDPVLDSINKQTFKPTKVVISVPQYSTRENKPYPLEQLKETVEKHGAVLNVIDVDYGPLTKLMGLLLKEPYRKGTLLITVDDDYVLNPKTVETLVNGAEMYPLEVVAISGMRIEYPHFFTSIGPVPQGLKLKSGDELNIVMGFGGVAYPRYVFGERSTIPDEKMESKRIGPQSIPQLHNHDDLYISAWLKQLGVKKRLIDPLDHKPLPQSASYALCAENNRKQTPLTMVKHVKRHLAVIKALHKQGLLEYNKEMNPILFAKDLPLVAAFTLLAATTAALVWLKFK
jgi:hypothetical protein